MFWVTGTYWKSNGETSPKLNLPGKFKHNDASRTIAQTNGANVSITRAQTLKTTKLQVKNGGGPTFCKHLNF